MKVWLAVTGETTTPFLDKDLAWEYVWKVLHDKYENEAPWYEPFQVDVVESWLEDNEVDNAE